MKKPSLQTQHRALKAQYKRTFDALQAANASVATYRNRATQAEQDAAEWKRRFDVLLARTSEIQR